MVAGAGSPPPPTSIILVFVFLPQLRQQLVEHEVVGPVADVEDEEDDGEEPHGDPVDPLVLVRVEAARDLQAHSRLGGGLLLQRLRLRRGLLRRHRVLAVELLLLLLLSPGGG